MKCSFLLALTFATLGCATAPPRATACASDHALEVAARNLYRSEERAFAEKNVDAFVPCTDPDSTYLVSADGEVHTCAAVREHARAQFRRVQIGKYAVTNLHFAVHQLIAHSSANGTVAYDFSFENHIVGADGKPHLVEIQGAHEDSWRCSNGVWELASMLEKMPQRVNVDGQPRQPAP